jgi:hypothetical protein
VTEFSNAPLAKKLGIKDASSVLLLHAPSAFNLDVGPGVQVRRQARGHCDVVVAFYTQRSKLDDEIEKLSRLITVSGGLWVAWPKKASKVVTDITDHLVRDVALSLGMVDNKVCAIDVTWTGLRLVWRVSQRDIVSKK